MPLLKNGHVAEDVWQIVADDAATPSDGPIVLSLARWQIERKNFTGRNAPIGVKLKNTDDVNALQADIDRLSLIVLDFPKYTDGRAYSQARILRERLDYTGELRATGQVLLDQLLFMQRCGFDAYDIDRPDAEDAWHKTQRSFDVFYQPTGDGRATVSELRRHLLGRAA